MRDHGKSHTMGPMPELRNAPNFWGLSLPRKFRLKSLSWEIKTAVGSFPDPQEINSSQGNFLKLEISNLHTYKEYSNFAL